MRARWSQERGTTLWVADYRVATTGTGVADVLREKHLAESRLGVVGLRSQAPTEMYGAIPANFWMELTAALPKAQWEDISEEFSHLMLVKSDEEMAQVRYAARAAEAACRVVVEVAAPGVGEEVVFAEATREMLRHGIGLRYPMIVMNSGPHTLSWGPPRWTTSGEAPRILARGDLMQAELMPLCGNQEVQVQMTVALDPLDETNLKCERVARASYEAGIKALKPGHRPSRISWPPWRSRSNRPAAGAIRRSCTRSVRISSWAAPRSTRSRPSSISVSPAPMRHVQRPAVLQPGMVLAFEPNACIGDHRVNIGGTVIVTATGCEELNHIPTSVTHKQ